MQQHIITPGTNTLSHTSTSERFVRANPRSVDINDYSSVRDVVFDAVKVGCLSFLSFAKAIIYCQYWLFIYLSYGVNCIIS